MAVITISRTFGSGGDELAYELCRKLGYQLFDKKLVETAAREAGFTGGEVPDLSEDNYKVRSLIERLFARVFIMPYMGIAPEDLAAMYAIESQASREEDSLQFVQAAVRMASERGNMVILGRGGQVILKDMPGVLHVRVDAPPDLRAERVLDTIARIQPAVGEQPQAQTEAVARDCIQERDAASADYIRRFYHADWSDPLFYHLVVNTGKYPIDRAAGLIARLARRMSAPALRSADETDAAVIHPRKISGSVPMQHRIGRVTHYYNRLGVAVLELTSPLALNDVVHLYGHTTDFFQKAWSLEIDHLRVTSAAPGQRVALKVVEPVRPGDWLYLVVETTPGAIIEEQMRQWAEER